MHLDRREPAWLSDAMPDFESTPQPPPAHASRLEDEQYHALSRNLRALARTLVGEDQLAEDLVQEAWLAALDAPPSQVRSLNAWLVRVVRNLALRHRRRGRRGEELERLMAAQEAVTGELAEVELRSSSELLRREVADLRDPYREVLQLRFFDDLGVPEMALRLARSESTIRTQIKRGIAELREALDRRHLGDRAAWSAVMVPMANRRKERVVASAGSGGFGVAVAWGSGLLLVAAIVFGTLRWVNPAARSGELAEAPAGSGRAPSAPGADSPQLELSPEGSREPALVTDGVDSVPEVEPPAEAPVRKLVLQVLHRDGLPAVDVTVQVEDRVGEITTYQQADGEFELSIPESGLAEVLGELGTKVRARSEQEAWSMAALIQLPREGARHLTLNTRGPARRIAGIVLTPEDEAASGVRLRLGPIGSQGRSVVEAGLELYDTGLFTHTDESGSFEFSGTPQLARNLHVFAPGFLPQTHQVLADSQGIELVLRLERGGELQGVVVRPDGSPASGARVWVSDELTRLRGGSVPETVADAEGRYRLENLPGEPRHVFAQDAQRKDWFKATVIVASQEEPVFWDAFLEPHPGVSIELVDSTGSSLGPRSVVLYRQLGSPPGLRPPLPMRTGWRWLHSCRKSTWRSTCSVPVSFRHPRWSFSAPRGALSREASPIPPSRPATWVCCSTRQGSHFRMPSCAGPAGTTSTTSRSIPSQGASNGRDCSRELICCT